MSILVKQGHQYNSISIQYTVITVIASLDISVIRAEDNININIIKYFNIDGIKYVEADNLQHVPMVVF